MPHAVCAYARKAPAPYPTPRRALFRRGCDGPGGGRRLPGQPAFCSDPDTRGAVFPARAAGRRRRRRGCLWCVCDAYGFILCAGRAREREAYQCVLLLVVVLRLWWSVCKGGGGGPPAPPPASRPAASPAWRASCHGHGHDHGDGHGNAPG